VHTALALVIYYYYMLCTLYMLLHGHTDLPRASAWNDAMAPLLQITKKKNFWGNVTWKVGTPSLWLFPSPRCFLIGLAAIPLLTSCVQFVLYPASFDSDAATWYIYHIPDYAANTQELFVIRVCLFHANKPRPRSRLNTPSGSVLETLDNCVAIT
jgi:hypothetical protein